MSGLGWQELFFILLIALIMFGGARLPEIGRSLGRAIKEFKRAFAAEDTEGQGPEEDNIS